MLPFFLALAVALTGVLSSTLSTFGDPGFTDFDLEARPAVEALRGGDVGGFLDACPSYCGSLVLRAPSLLVPGADGDQTLFAAAMAPGVLAAVAIALALWRRARSLGRGPLVAALALGLAAFSPLIDPAVAFGHAEEIIVAAAIAGAMLAARSRRPVLCGLLLGIAVGSKLWPIIVVAPVVLALGEGRRRALAAAAVTASLLLAPMLLAAGGALEESAAVAQSAGTAVEPAQVWWFLGDPDVVVRDGAGIVQEGYRAAPAWVARISHPLVVAVPLLLTLVLAPRLRRRPREDLLLLVVAVLLLRGMLDVWNTAYYPLALTLAALAWELHARRGLPVASAALSVLAWLSFVQLPLVLSPDAVSATYLLWSVPLAAALVVRLARGPALAQPQAPQLPPEVRPRAPLAAALGDRVA